MIAPFFIDTQRTLSKAQAIPVVGFLLASPVKALFSTLEFIVGIAATIFFGTGAVLILNDKLAGYAWKALQHAGLGLTGICYSIGNVLSLGLLGYRIESIVAQIPEKI
jgi:hypothetical protein